MLRILPYFFVAIAMVVIYILIQRSVKLSRETNQKEWVAWCVTKNSQTFRCALSLSDYIKNAQISAHVQDVYRIHSEEEWDMVKAILDGFKAKLTEDYFSDLIPYKSSKYVIPGEHFFMFRLFCYLADHQCESNISGHDMHNRTISHKSYGSYGGPLYDATYELSDFGVVFHKLYYISYLFCKRSPFFNGEIAGWLTDKTFADILDSGQLSVYRT